MINGETRKALGMAFAVALAGAIGTKVGEWLVESLRVTPKEKAKEPER